MRLCSHQREKAVERQGLGHRSRSSLKMDDCVNGTLINSSIQTLVGGGSPVWRKSKKIKEKSRKSIFLHWASNVFPLLRSLCDWRFRACSDEYTHKHTHHFLFHLNGTSSQCNVEGINAVDVQYRTSLMILLRAAINTSFRAPFDDFTIMSMIKEPWWISMQHVFEGNTDRPLQVINTYEISVCIYCQPAKDKKRIW